MRARVVSTVRNDAPTASASARTEIGSVEPDSALVREELRSSSNPRFNPTIPVNVVFDVSLLGFSTVFCGVIILITGFIWGFWFPSIAVCCVLSVFKPAVNPGPNTGPRWRNPAS
jgi:hypothetical protein